MVDYIIVVKIWTLKNMEACPLPKCLHCPQALEEPEVTGRTQHRRPSVRVLRSENTESMLPKSFWSDILLCFLIKFNHSLGDYKFRQ